MKVIIQQRSVYHKYAEVEVEIPNSIKEEDISEYLIEIEDRIAPLVLIAAVLGFLISYIKARSESLGIPCEGGFAERTERLIIVLITTGFSGLGIPYVLAIGFWVLTLSSLLTVFQRLAIVYRGAA